MSDISLISGTDHGNISTRGIRVWDLPVRLFHWGLVVGVSTALVTGFLAEEWYLDIHSWAGYTIAFLISFRLIWGFVGSKYARFASFIFTPKETIGHIKEFARGNSAHYSGHNPAGALMVFTLLAVLFLLTVSGVIILGGQENLGALAGFISFEIGAFLVEIHELLAWSLILLIIAHVAGMIIESRISNENLALAMVTGKKKDTSSEPITMSVSTIALRAVVIAAIVGGAGFTLYQKYSAVPASGLVRLVPNETYNSECGDCHYAYHPSLLPKSSWQGIMANLDDHFGEDASLDAETVKSISAWLNENSSEAWDTEAANNLREVSPKSPLSISETPYWLLRHSEIDKNIFKQANIGTKGNCVACHSDAKTGRFDDAAISIPPPKPNT